MKKLLGIIILSLLLSGNALANDIEAFCLIKRQDLIKAELAPLCRVLKQFSYFSLPHHN